MVRSPAPAPRQLRRSWRRPARAACWRPPRRCRPHQARRRQPPWSPRPRAGHSAAARQPTLATWVRVRPIRRTRRWAARREAQLAGAKAAARSGRLLGRCGRAPARGRCWALRAAPRPSRRRPRRIRRPCWNHRRPPGMPQRRGGLGETQQARSPQPAAGRTGAECPWGTRARGSWTAWAETSPS
jgi:hypothetical protein